MLSTVAEVLADLQANRDMLPRGEPVAQHPTERAGREHWTPGRSGFMASDAELEYIRAGGRGEPLTPSVAMQLVADRIGKRPFLARAFYRWRRAGSIPEDVFAGDAQTDTVIRQAQLQGWLDDLT